MTVDSMSKLGVAAGYNETVSPNRYGQSQRVVQSKLDHLDQLSGFNCHPDTRQFLCLYYLPYCSSQYREFSEPLLPCRELCLAVKDNCDKYIKRYSQLHWPEDLDCQATVNTYTVPHHYRRQCGYRHNWSGLNKLTISETKEKKQPGKIVARNQIRIFFLRQEKN